MDNPIFASWYTDTADIYRVQNILDGSITRQSRELIAEAVQCRVYSSQKDGPVMTDTAARERSSDKMACDVGVDIRAGDEILITRGGALGSTREPDRYIAGNPQHYYDPVGAALTGLSHQEVGLLMHNTVR